MSQENVEIVRHAFQALTAEGVDAALSFVPPDVVWYPTDRWLDDSAYRGHEGMRMIAAAFSENFDDFRFEVHDVRDAQDRVVVERGSAALDTQSGQSPGLATAWRDRLLRRQEVTRREAPRWSGSARLVVTRHIPEQRISCSGGSF
jgi:ketosteroid isomerase-like protein